MISKKLIFSTLLIAFGLVGCASQLTGKERLPNGTLDEIAATPKRQSTEAENKAILLAIQALAKDSNSVEITDVWVDNTNQELVGFCGQARGEESKGKMAPFTGLYGILTSAGGTVEAKNIKVGKAVTRMCHYMKYPISLPQS